MRFRSVACFCACALGAAAQTTHAPTLDDVMGLKIPSYMVFSSAGDQIVYTHAGLWAVSTKSRSAPKRLTKTGLLPAWSPDGKRLAYYSTESGSQQLWVMDMASGRAEPVTNLDGGIHPDIRTRMVGWFNDSLRYSWSPDGARIVFASQVEAPGAKGNGAPVSMKPDAATGTPLVLDNRTPPEWTLSGIFNTAFGPPPPGGVYKTDPLAEAKVNQLFIVDLASKQVRQLTTDGGVYFGPAWSPDGTTVLCASSEGRNPWTGPTNIYAIDPATGRKTALTTGAGDKRLPRWSPDGKWIAYTGGQHFGMQSVFVIPASGGAPRNVTAAVNRYITESEWMADSKSLVVLCWDAADWPLIRVPIADGKPERLTGGAAAMRQFFAVSRDGKIAWEHSDGSSVGVILQLAPGATAPAAVLDLNPQIREWTMGAQEVVQWKNSRGEPLEGVLLKPVGFRAGQKYPLIVDGYPAQPNSFKAAPMWGNQGWANRGYAVFWPAARAPHTWMNAYRDQAFSEAVRGPQGWSIMADDVISGVDELIRRGIVDPERMGLYGFSNGGGVVNYLVTQTNRFRCAASVAGVYPDWVLPALLHTDSTIQTFEGGDGVWDDPSTYVRLSAVFRAGNITTPMLLADGDNDGDFLLGTIEMFNSLRSLGKEVTLLRYPGQGHGFTGPSLKDFVERRDAFFDRYLKPAKPQ